MFLHCTKRFSGTLYGYVGVFNKANIVLLASKQFDKPWWLVKFLTSVVQNTNSKDKTVVELEGRQRRVHPALILKTENVPCPFGPTGMHPALFRTFKY